MMRGLSRSVFLSLMMGLSSGCVSYSQTSRVQKPIIQVPPATPVALVSVDVAKKVMEKMPSDFSNAPGMVAGALQEAFAETALQIVDRRATGYILPIEPTAQPERKFLGMTVEEDPLPDDTQTYQGTAPADLPDAVSEPLVLAVRVLDWRLFKPTPKKGQTRAPGEQASVDLVYSLWTRGGREIETQRVRTGLSFMAKLSSATKFVPARPVATGLDQAKSFVFASGALDREKLFRQAVDGNARAFAFPYDTHEIPTSVQWDDSSELVKPGIELAKQGKLQDAVRAWAELLKSNAQLAPAAFNIGVVQELLGEDEDALERYDAALAVDAEKGLYRRTRGALARRHELRRSIAPSPSE